MPEVDFTDTFLPTLKLDSLQVMLAIVYLKDLEVHQLDIVNAYIAEELQEEIYMQALKVLGLPNKSVLLLLQAIYRLKQLGCVLY